MFIAILQSGCSIIPPATTVQNYQLSIGEQAVHCNAPTLKGVLRIEQPSTNQMLDSSHIVVLTNNNATTIYKGARWNDTAPAILRDYLVQSLQQSGCLQTISSNTYNLNSDFALEADLYAFQGEYLSGNSEVRIHYFAYLVDSQTRNIITSKDFNIKEPINNNNMEGVITTFGIATNRLSEQIVQWINNQKLLSSNE